VEPLTNSAESYRIYYSFGEETPLATDVLEINNEISIPNNALVTF